MSSQRTSPPTCRGCGRPAPRKTPQPNGWYNLSVNVPTTFDPRGYTWLGIFCSTDRLEQHFPDIRNQDLLTQNAYTRE